MELEEMKRRLVILVASMILLVLMTKTAFANCYEYKKGQVTTCVNLKASLKSKLQSPIDKGSTICYVTDQKTGKGSCVSAALYDKQEPRKCCPVNEFKGEPKTGSMLFKSPYDKTSMEKYVYEAICSNLATVYYMDFDGFCLATKKPAPSKSGSPSCTSNSECTSKGFDYCTSGFSKCWPLTKCTANSDCSNKEECIGGYCIMDYDRDGYYDGRIPSKYLPSDKTDCDDSIALCNTDCTTDSDSGKPKQYFKIQDPKLEYFSAEDVVNPPDCRDSCTDYDQDGACSNHASRKVFVTGNLGKSTEQEFTAADAALLKKNGVTTLKDRDGNIPGDGFFGLQSTFQWSDAITYRTDKSSPYIFDCDDKNPKASPFEDEKCDTIDNDCDGVVDECESPKKITGIVSPADATIKMNPPYPMYDQDTSTGEFESLNLPAGAYTITFSKSGYWDEQEYVTLDYFDKYIGKIVLTPKTQSKPGGWAGSGSMPPAAYTIAKSYACVYTKTQIGCKAWDNDGDGYKNANFGCPECTDCNDYNKNINPDATELTTNSEDDNCNGITDEDISDSDGDGIPSMKHPVKSWKKLDECPKEGSNPINASGCWYSLSKNNLPGKWSKG
jgi:hypothetical protein